MIDFSSLRQHYSHFLSNHPHEIFLTGHSHQFWLDASRDAHTKAWDDAAKHVDDKWAIVFGEVIPKFQSHVAKRIGEMNPSLIAFGQNTLEFSYRLLSSFPSNRPMHIVTTTSEFHSLSRLLARMKEEGVEVSYVSTENRDTLTERIIDAITERTTLVMISLVLFDTSYVVQRVKEICARAKEVGAQIFLDAYHAFNVLPLSIDEMHEDVFLVGGGYKYAQSGEGAAWMRIPKHTQLRPMYTGWFADFAGLESSDARNSVQYASDAFRFVGATFDPTPFYRANAVFDFFDAHGLTPEVLRARSLALTTFIIELFDSLKLESLGLELASSRLQNERGGFISFSHAHAIELCARLQKNGIRSDARGKHLRFGPAPFLLEEEIEKAMRELNIVLENF